MSEARNNQEPTPEYDLMSDIDDVGSLKALGYLPLITLGRLGEDIDSLQSKYKERDLGTFVDKKGVNVQGGALYFYDPVMLGQILQPYEAVLKREKWPTEPDQFTEEVAKRYGKGDMEYIIARAFNDPRPEFQEKLELTPRPAVREVARRALSNPFKK